MLDFCHVSNRFCVLVLTSYQGESRAIKWLHGLDLPVAEQRLVLSSAGVYEVEKILVSLELHFAGQVPPSKSRFTPKDGGKGKGEGKGKPHAVH
eukprot:2262477-Amphidinium_carterae.1